MTHAVEGNVAATLVKGDACLHEHWIDADDNIWEIHEDREGLSLHAVDGNANIPYWTTYVVRLPGLHRM